MKAKNAFISLWLALSLLVSLSVAGCKAGPPVIEIESPEAAISPMLIGVASVFMKINNTGSEDTLTSARADIEGTVTELHDIKDGKMTKIDSIAIPPDSTVVLRPARFHIMIFKLPKTVKEGDHFRLLLNFKKSGEKAVQLQLTKFSPGSRERK
jgi:copper(I)-binding protein